MSNLVPIWKQNSINNHLFNDLDRMVETFFNTKDKDNFFPACDIQETEKHLLLSFDLPGLSQDDIKIEINKSNLSISGERKQQTNQNGKPHLFERRFGKFKRQFQLPDWLDKQNVKAEYTNGVLRLLIPRNAESETREIEVKAESSDLLDMFSK